MVVPLETARNLAPASDATDHRVVRIRFEGRSSLLDAFALAQKESWIEDCHVSLPRLELVIRMAGSLEDLVRALVGEIGMSDVLDALGDALFNGRFPNLYRRLAPDTEKPLGSWMQHFSRRQQQYE